MVNPNYMPVAHGGDDDLRPAPLDLGRIVSLTFEVLSRKFLPIAVVTVITSLIGIIQYRQVTKASMIQLGLMDTQLAFVPGEFGKVLTDVLGTAAIACIVVGYLDGRRTRLGEATVRVVRNFLPLLCLCVIISVGIVGGWLLLIVPGAMLSTRWMVVTPVRIIEGASIPRTLARSAALTRGHRWRLLALLLAYFAGTFGLDYGAKRVLMAISAEPGIIPAMIRSDEGMLPVYFVLRSISSTAIAVCYVELRRLLDGDSAEKTAAVFA